MKRIFQLLSLFLAWSIFFCSMPFNVHAEDSDSFEVLAPTIDISTDKNDYRTFDTAEVTVKVFANAEMPIEDVNIETTLDNQLSCISASSLSKTTTLLTDEPIGYSFGVVVAKNANGLNIFQRIISFFKNLFRKTYTVTGKTYDDGRVKSCKTLELSFGSVTGTITIDIWYQGRIQKIDTDGDNLIDYYERVNGLNPNLADTDDDGLNDFDELVIVGTDPIEEDTDGNGISDYDDDNDHDGLSNGIELSIGTSANSSDTDCDGLDDRREIDVYNSDPTKEDTDGDGASDGWEVENGFDPTRYNSTFKVNIECDNGNLSASATVTVNGETAESITVTPVKDNPLINETIPGYLGSAFEFCATGDLGIARITFSFDKSLQNIPDFNPTIYCLNEETQSWYEYETIVNGNSATAQSTHFSTYILINKSVYERHLENQSNVDYSLDTGIDSNNDGINDYVTKLMCDGIIRTGTGTKVFGNYSFEQIQKNSDIDGDGIKNGDEISENYQLKIPDDAIEYGGHYYKRFDVGYVWDDAEAYCESIGGYLATITSSGEQKHIESLLSNGKRNSYWLGARKQNGSFKWLTNEPFTYKKWAWGQPDNHSSSGFEDCLMIYNARNPRNINKIGEWNDLNNHAICGNEPFFGINNFGFICEWGEFNSGDNSYTFVDSSPIYKDTDSDGFADGIDPTPQLADVFASMKDYKKYFFDDCNTVTFFAKQPTWDSRSCYRFSDPDTTHGYYTSGASGHSFLGTIDKEEKESYFGFGGDTSEFNDFGFLLGFAAGGGAWKPLMGLIGGEILPYPLTAITRREIPGVWGKEKLEFSVGKTFVINDIEEINTFRNSHRNDKYQISKNNCTTMAVNALKACGINPRIYEHNWTADNALAAFSWTYYGYTPADACQDIKAYYKDYITYKYYKLRDNSTVLAVEAIRR